MVSLKRHLTVREMFALQGYNVDELGIVVPSSLTQLQVCCLIGNSFHGSVLKELFKGLLPILLRKHHSNGGNTRLQSGV